ncbi:MAG: hypothetical protein WB014_15400, partial [Methanosarcina sp.]
NLRETITRDGKSWRKKRSENNKDRRYNSDLFNPLTFNLEHITIPIDLQGKNSKRPDSFLY